jgi:hypothetical protein
VEDDLIYASDFRGVFWDARHQQWAAVTETAGRLVCLGRYPFEIEAALVVDDAEWALHGPFARLNFCYVDQKKAREYTGQLDLLNHL